MKTIFSLSRWKKEASYAARYAGSGIANTIVGVVIIFSAMAFGISPALSNVLGYAVGFLLGFVLSKKFVFRSNGRYVTESIRYLGAFITSFFVNIAMLKLALDYWGFNVVIAQLIAISSYTSLMFVLSRFVVFVGQGEGRRASCDPPV